MGLICNDVIENKEGKFIHSDEWVFETMETRCPELKEKIKSLKDVIDSFAGTGIEIRICVKFD